MKNPIVSVVCEILTDKQRIITHHHINIMVQIQAGVGLVHLRRQGPEIGPLVVPGGGQPLVQRGPHVNWTKPEI